MTTLLAFDTSAAHCAAALLMNGKVVANAQEAMKKGQAERLMPLLQEIMDSQGAVWEELDGIGVGVGPGNFTGVRISVSAARGLALGLGIPAVGVSTFEAMQNMCGNRDGPLAISLPSTRKDHVMVQYLDGDAALTPPFELRIFGAEPDKAPDFPDEGATYGAESSALMWAIGESLGKSVTAMGEPVDPQWAISIAMVASRKLGADSHVERPKPLYIRPADAAPPKDPAPVVWG